MEEKKYLKWYNKVGYGSGDIAGNVVYAFLIILGFVLSALLRVSQGSTTVALVTTSSILGTAIAQSGVSPILVGLAICAGGIGFSLPNDSGFWVISRFAGISVSDMIKSWTIGGTIASCVVFVVVMILSAINGMVPLPFL